MGKSVLLIKNWQEVWFLSHYLKISRNLKSSPEVPTEVCCYYLKYQFQTLEGRGLIKTKCFQSFSSCQIETCMIYILALDLSSGKISDFCFLWIKTYVQSNNCLIKTAIFQKLSKLRPNFFLSCFFRICACFVLNLSRELQTKDF